MSPLAARGESPAAFDRRRIPPRGAAPRSNRPTILLRCALPGVPRPARDALSLSTGGRLTGLGATRDFHHGLLVSYNSGSRTDSRAGHPAWQRCSSVTNAKFAPSLRLASSGAAPGTLSTNYCYRTLAQPALNSWSIFLFLLMLMFMGEICPASAQPVEPVNDLPNPYRTVDNYFKMPEGRTWGATSAVDIDTDGTSIWVAERCGANSCAGSNLPIVLSFDATGRMVKSFGAGIFLFPHGFHVDTDGNVWVTDAQGPDGEDPSRDGKGHQVVKFSPEGEVLLTLGTPGVAGDGSDALLNEPCDVVTAPNGDIFVAEGHAGQYPGATPDTVARIVKFDKNGRLIKYWGGWGAAPGEFKTPHGLAFDSRGRLFVADRGNNRIQIFDQDGTFLEEWTQFGRLSGIFIDSNDMLYGADSESNETRNPGWKRGTRVGSARTGEVMYFIPDPESNPGRGTSAAEGVAVDAQGNIYGAEVGPRALKKYVAR